MKKEFLSGGARFFVVCCAAILCVALYAGGTPVSAQRASLMADPTPAPIVRPVDSENPHSPDMISGVSYHNDVSRPLRKMKQVELRAELDTETPHEANKNPKLNLWHFDAYDPVIQGKFFESLFQPQMPGTILNFDGIPYPGVACNCAPPDTDGEVGATQYVQIVNKGYQVFDKTTGASVLGPASIVSLWSGFGGVCQTNGDGDPVVLYDQLAGRWIITQFAGASGVPTDECIAVSTTSDATGSYNRYAFHLGSSFFDYPKLSVWPDGYYMSMDVFNSAGTISLGPQPFAFDRAKMLAGQAATFVSTAGPLAPSNDSFKPADLDGSNPPPAGAPDTFVSFPGSGSYVVYHFHVDFATPANSTFTTFATLPAAGFTALCPSTQSCVPQLGTTSGLDGLGDRLMHRLAYRNFGDHDAVLGNYTVSAGGASGLRWFELRNVSLGPPTVFQESTYQPDSTWRWMGSAAMDALGDLAIGYSSSSGSIHPEIRYTGRLVSDPLNNLAQGETTMFAGSGSQTGTSNRWGDYSAMSVDPTDDCTFWYTQEYYSTTTSFGWRTRIANFKFPTCTAGPTGTIHFAVTACAGGTNIAGAAVSIDGDPVAQTLADGTFDVTVGTGSHSYSISKSGYATMSGNATVDQNVTTPVSLCLTTVPVIAPGGPVTLVSDSGGNGSIDPGELVTVNVPLVNNGLAPTTNLVSTLQFGGGVASIAGTNPQTYGALAPGGGTPTQPYSFRVSSGTTCGSNITMTFTLQDGASNLGSAVFPVPTGTLQTSILLAQNFDGVTAPALPSGWSSAQIGSLPLWVTSATAPDTPTNDVFASEVGSVATTDLLSPQFAVPATGGTISFRNLFNLERSVASGNGHDGMVLEYALDGSSTFQDITASGNAFTAGGYDATMDAGFGSPIAGRMAWTGLSGGTTAAPAYITSTISLPAAAAGHSIQLRWRVATDNSVVASGAAGARIDSLTVMSQTVSCQTPTAAKVGLSGRVVTVDGAGLRNAVVTLHDQNGKVRSAITSGFGYYHFDDVEVGSYLVGVTSRRYIYASRLVNVDDSLANIDFTPRR